MDTKVILQVKALGFPWETNDPFLFCAYHRDEYPAGNEKMGPDVPLTGRQIGQDFTIKDGWRMYHGSTVPGFPYHPHKGFETITINREGYVDHTDSLGAAGRFGKGDVQWMTAGKGVQHSEMFPLVHKDSENTLEIFQIWLNLPRSSKLVAPHFKMLWREDIPVIHTADSNGNGVDVQIIAGVLDGVHALDPTPDSWAADSANDVQVWTIQMDPGATFTIPEGASASMRSLYFYKGDTIEIQDQRIHSSHLVHLKADKEIAIRNGEEKAYFLLLQGKPIQETVVQYGPFVMNTQEEIQEAFAEYRATQYGGWPWPEAEQTHPRHKGRFALHADGREETPDN